MDSEVPREVVGPAQVKPVVEFHEVSKWYGNVIGINKLTINVPAGVTGLLGPTARASPRCCNWRPASCFRAKARSAFLAGRLELPVVQRLHRPLPRTGRFLRMDDGLGLRLHLGTARRPVPGRVRDAAKRTLDAVGMTKHKDRIVRGYSKGMRDAPSWPRLSCMTRKSCSSTSR